MKLLITIHKSNPRHYGRTWSSHLNNFRCTCHTQFTVPDGQSALCIAAGSGDVETCRVRLHHGASADCLDEVHIFSLSEPLPVSTLGENVMQFNLFTNCFRLRFLPMLTAGIILCMIISCKMATLPQQFA